MAAATRPKRRNVARPATAAKPRKQAANEFERQLSDIIVIEALRFSVWQATAAQERILGLVKQVEIDVLGPFAKKPDPLLRQVLAGLAELYMATGRIRTSALDALPPGDRNAL